VRVGVIRTLAFTFCGTGAALAGIILGSRVQTGQADAGANIVLTVIAGVVIGGVSIFGGEGAIWRAVLGILLLTLIGNGFNLLNVNPIYQQILQGAIILLAVAIDAWSRGTPP
jgi:ribose transport system permease protein